MAVKKEDVIEYLKSMTLLEASELVKELEEVFGVSAAAAAAPMMMAAGAGAAATLLLRLRKRIRLTLSFRRRAATRSPLSRSFAKSSPASA